MSAPQAMMLAYSPRIASLFGKYVGEKRLNVGCASNHEVGFDNMDLDPNVKPDIVGRLGSDLPIPDNTYDTIFASHVLEHVPKADLFKAFTEMHRILKPGGYLIGVTPYGSSDDAWDNPHHIQLFDEYTYAMFCKKLYEVEHAGYHAWEGQEYRDWTIIKVVKAPYPEFASDKPEDLAWKIKHLRNVIQEIQVVVRADK